MSDPRRMGIAFCEQPFGVREVVSAVREAERVGYESAWVAQDLWTRRDGLTYLSCLALQTDSIVLGTSVVTPYTNHPVRLAMMFSTLWELAPKRLRLGIGAGTQSWRPLYDDAMRSWPPLKAVREAIETVRTLAAGGDVSVAGENLSLRTTRPGFTDGIPPAVMDLPVYVGATGPKMTALAGEIADGLILGTWLSPAEVGERREWLEVGARRRGRRAAELDVAGIIVTSVSDDGSIDRNTRQLTAVHVARLTEPEVRALGVDSELAYLVRNLVAARRIEEAGALLPIEVISIWTATGTKQQCLARIESYVRGGIDLPVLFTYGCDLRALVDLGSAFINNVGAEGLLN